MDEDQSKTRRERRSKMMRHQIAEAAAILFAQKGFHNTTTKEIARAADVSEGSIYNYFENKEDILFGVIENIVTEELQNMRLIPSLEEDPVEYLFSRFIHQKEKVAKKNPIIQSILAEIIFNAELRQRYVSQFLNPIMDQVSAHLKSRIELGQIRDFPPQHLTRILVSLIFGLYFYEMLEDDITKNCWEELSRTTVKVMFEGIKAEP